MELLLRCRPCHPHYDPEDVDDGEEEADVGGEEDVVIEDFALKVEKGGLPDGRKDDRDIKIYK